MIQVLGYCVMTYLMQLSVRVETAECPSYLNMMFYRKEINTTNMDLFLMHSIFLLAKFYVLHVHAVCGSY